MQFYIYLEKTNMEILIYQNSKYATIAEAARILEINVNMVNYYFKKGRLQMIKLDSVKLVNLDSLLLLNHELANRATKK